MSAHIFLRVLKHVRIGPISHETPELIQKKLKLKLINKTIPAANLLSLAFYFFILTKKKHVATVVLQGYVGMLSPFSPLCVGVTRSVVCDCFPAFCARLWLAFSFVPRLCPACAPPVPRLCPACAPPVLGVFPTVSSLFLVYLLQCVHAARCSVFPGSFL